MVELDLKLTLLSLACGPIGTRVLVKEPKGGRDIQISDVFKYNDDFTSKLYRVKINTIQVTKYKNSLWLLLLLLLIITYCCNYIIIIFIIVMTAVIISIIIYQLSIIMYYYIIINNILITIDERVSRGSRANS